MLHFVDQTLRQAQDDISGISKQPIHRIVRRGWIGYDEHEKRTSSRVERSVIEGSREEMDDDFQTNRSMD